LAGEYNNDLINTTRIFNTVQFKSMTATRVRLNDLLTTFELFRETCHRVE